MTPYRLACEVLAFALWSFALFVLGHVGGIKSEQLVMQAKLDAIVQDDQSKLIAAQQAAADETKRRLEAARSQDHEDLTRAEKRADAAAVSADAAERLRQRTAVVAATCSGGNPAVAGFSPAASSPGDLLAYVQRRMDEAARSVVGYADAAGDASESCAARYDALTPRAP